MKIDIVGKGKVGVQLYGALSEKSGIEALLVDSRKIGGVRNEADIVILAVSDSAIGEVAAKLKDFPGIIAHTSGTTDMSALGRTSGCGVFYPLQSFSEGVEVDFAAVPFLIEGSDTRSQALLTEAAQLLSGKVLEADSEKRGRLHLAAVFACNFVNEMIGIGFDLLKQGSLSEDLLHPLIKLTIAKALGKGPHNVRTGPAQRRDWPTIKRQEAMLAGNPDYLAVYKAVTNAILGTVSYNSER